MEVSNENKTGIPKKYVYVLAVVVVALGLFLTLNAYSFFWRSTPQNSEYSTAQYAQSSNSTIATGGVIPSQVGGCN